MSKPRQCWVCCNCGCDTRYGSHHAREGCWPAGPRLEGRRVFIPPKTGGEQMGEKMEEVMLAAFIEQQTTWQEYAAASNKYHQMVDLLTVEQMEAFQQLARIWLRNNFRDKH